MDMGVDGAVPSTTAKKIVLQDAGGDMARAQEAWTAAGLPGTGPVSVEQLEQARAAARQAGSGASARLQADNSKRRGPRTGGGPASSGKLITARSAHETRTPASSRGVVVRAGSGRIGPDRIDPVRPGP